MHRIRRYSVIAIAAGMLVGGLMVSSLPASAKATPTPKLKVSPKSKLTNGATVAVSGKGFKAEDSIFLVECVVGETSTTGSGCNISSPVAVTVSSKGTWGPVNFKVASGAVGTQGWMCGTTKANEKDCAVSAGNAQGTDAAQEVIAFTVPK